MKSTLDAAATDAPGHAEPRGAWDAANLAARYQEVRRGTERLCEPLAAEDYVVQSMPDVSPTKWHLAHTSWFFETFVLASALPDYRPYHPRYGYLFNSYYEAVGARHPRPERGLLSRPTVEEVYRYRQYVDRHMADLLAECDAETWDELEPLVLLGLHHEQQHGELLLTDLKYNLSINPLRPAYRPSGPPPARPAVSPARNRGRAAKCDCRSGR